MDVSLSDEESHEEHAKRGGRKSQGRVKPKKSTAVDNDSEDKDEPSAYKTPPP